MALQTARSRQQQAYLANRQGRMCVCVLQCALTQLLLSTSSQSTLQAPAAPPSTQ
jgi:hypothetical protein